MVFSYGIIGGVRAGRRRSFRRVVRERPRVYLFPRGVLLGLECSICGVPLFYFLLRRMMVWAAMADAVSRAVARVAIACACLMCSPSCEMTMNWIVSSVGGGRGVPLVSSCLVFPPAL